LPPPPDIDAAATAFFVDFDGTLAPIVDRPELAAMAPDTRAAVSKLQARAGGAVAVISGRALADLDRMLAPLVLPASGSHGLERRDADGVATAAEGDAAAQTAIEAVAAFGRSNDLLVERKQAGAAVHFRARPDLAEAAHAAVAAAASAAGDRLRTLRGDMVAELSLAHVDKGHAVRAFMAEPPFRGRRPLFAGDDVTDEDGFKAATALGGLAIKIGEGPTAATHRLPSIDDFLVWLARIAG